MSSVRFADAVGGNSCVIGGPFGSKLTQRDYQDDGVPVIRGTNMQGGRVIDGDFAFVSEEKWSRDFKTNTARPGDIIITQRGTLGQVSTVPLNFKYDKLVVSQSQMAVRVNSKYADPLFVYYYLTSSSFDEYISSVTIQTGVPHINMGILRNAPVDWPDRGTQTEIAGVLSALDDKIELNRRMNETLEAEARALFRDWFVDFGPVKAKMAGDAPYLAPDLWSLFPDRLNDDGVPEGWERTPLTEHFDIIGGGTPKTSVAEYWDGAVPWFSVVDTPRGSDVFVFNTEKSITIEGVKNSSAKLVRAGTTIISARGTVGNLAMAAQEMTFNQSCYALQGREGASDAFVYLAAKNMVDRLNSMAHGSVFSTITRRTFEGLSLMRPSPAMHQAFGDLASVLFDKIRSNVSESQTLAETRDVLLPKLMSGEIRLSLPERQQGHAG